MPFPLNVVDEFPYTVDLVIHSVPIKLEDAALCKLKHAASVICCHGNLSKVHWYQVELLCGTPLPQLGEHMGSKKCPLLHRQETAHSIHTG